jgi:hypothetical protein
VPAATLYCSLSFVFTLIAFLTFRVDHGLTHYFSVHDAVSIISAVIAAGLTTIRTDRVIVGGDESLLSAAALDGIAKICGGPRSLATRVTGETSA